MSDLSLDVHSSEVKPPLPVERWLDFIIASAAHRSANAGHQKFGADLVQRYFVSLPERYKEDPVATLYFDEMLCLVASALRGFSVMRDDFQSAREHLKAEKEAQMKRIEHLNSFSPLSKDGIWGKIGSLAVGIGVVPPLTKLMKTSFEKSPLPVLAGGLASVVVAFVVLELIINFLRDQQEKRAEKTLPVQVMDHWDKKTMQSYKNILCDFATSATVVTDKYYSGACKTDFSKEELCTIIDARFSLSQT